MNFEQAWNEMEKRNGKKEIENGIPMVEILYESESGRPLSATKDEPNFHKNKDKVKDEVRRAWETYCRTKPAERLDSIERINLRYKKTA